MLFLPEPLRNSLNTPLVNQSWVWLDHWSVVHLITGMIFSLIFWKLKKWYKWLIVFLLLAGYEFYEGRYWNIYFIPEPPINVAWDLIVGMCGFSLVCLIKKIFSKKEDKDEKLKI